MTKPGMVAPCGRITTRDGKLLAAGTIYVTLTQALKAYRYGWRIIGATCDQHERAYYSVRRSKVVELPDG